LSLYSIKSVPDGSGDGTAKTFDIINSAAICSMFLFRNAIISEHPLPPIQIDKNQHIKNGRQNQPNGLQQKNISGVIMININWFVCENVCEAIKKAVHIIYVNG